MDKETLERIADYHIRAVDKFYRMFAGLSSKIDDYTDATIYLTISKNSMWRKDNETTARQIARSWRNVNKELRDATRYHVTIIDSEAATGFVFNMTAADDSATIASAIAALKNAPTIDDLKKMVPGVVITGDFDDLEEVNPRI